MKWNLIVSDVDGCISPEESAAWDLDPFVELARRLRGDLTGNGGAPDLGSPGGAKALSGGRSLPFTLCTGRPQPYVEVLAKLLDIRLPLICENGAVIYELATNRSESGPGVTAGAVEVVRAVRAYLESRLPEFPGSVVQYGKEAQLSIFSPAPDATAHLAEAARSFAEREAPGSVHIDSSHYYLNISISGGDKGTALSWLQRKLGVGPEATAVIGDTSGDLAMREHAAFFAAPANATAQVKAAADWVSEKTDVHAVLEFVERVESESS